MKLLNDTLLVFTKTLRKLLGLLKLFYLLEMIAGNTMSDILHFDLLLVYFFYLVYVVQDL